MTEKIEFDDFWLNFPKKVSKPQALRAFNRLKSSDKKKAIADCIKRYVYTDRQFIPNPATYLNNHKFNDPKDGDEKQDRPKMPERFCSQDGCNEECHGPNYNHCTIHIPAPETPVIVAMRKHYKDSGMVKRDDESAHDHSKRLRKMFLKNVDTVLDVMDEFK